ncbi:hypothetical protein GTP55_21285 [Duganella sp. FT109W]|uniref:Uncharacterized protein n=1 Tax=Duganella margarita TaxID=2692170 RepID=A0ABW9WM39_9BURK|nr:hypothetical protein [Duganella margarita]MYN41895.1 hypothetical protein [Duganella margarita]
MSSFSFLFLLLIVALYAGSVKLAALLYKRARLSWRDASIFSLILLLLLGAGMLLNRLSGDVIPDLVAVAASVVIQVGIGAWYLAARARTLDGKPVGSKGAAMLSLIAYGLLVPLVMVWAVMHSAMMH